ncbi:antitoxin Xre/MbcA/ParS toxin-binding domain-containing protein [Microbulbifer elongatus]|uniref:antitoxin Xre/MbcA/ParS toxin-binding domain-containing protein n=1 Tax=Microbulbifer elongatus TaxID=86173 RepID=UPI001CFD21C1
MIHKTLRRLFPRNIELAYSWMSQSNHAFNGLTPIRVVEREGLMGLYAIDFYLNEKCYS